ncbi:MAG: hypothetical protein ACOY0T_05125 [Myxococcota bacterium]
MHAENALPTFDYDQRLPGRFHFPARMSVLPLSQGKLALVSPIPINERVAESITRLGEVSFLIAPNLLHHLYLEQALQHFPKALVLVPERLRAKRPNLRIDGTLERDLPSQLVETVDVVKFEGTPVLDEFVFFHRARRTLVVTDLVFNVVAPRGLMANLVLFLVGCHGKLAQSRAVRFTIKNSSAASESAQRILAFDFDTLVMAHGDVVREQAQPQLARALRSLLPEPRVLPAAQ